MDEPRQALQMLVSGHGRHTAAFDDLYAAVVARPDTLAGLLAFYANEELDGSLALMPTLRALWATATPDLVVQTSRHLADELRHADLLWQRARELGGRVGRPPRGDELLASIFRRQTGTEIAYFAATEPRLDFRDLLAHFCMGFTIEVRARENYAPLVRRLTRDERTRALLVRQMHDEDFHVSYLARALEGLARAGHADAVDAGLREAHRLYEEVIDVSYGRLRDRLVPDAVAV
ncbi:MAG TPA: ferritin-like domain-containing protein [Candidatus Binatia bacterium]|nr:ferritin-like domain-containing protein [Candidatus Binatia bacterium]